MQGYLISRPLLTKDVRSLFAKFQDIERNKVAQNHSLGDTPRRV